MGLLLAALGWAVIFPFVLFVQWDLIELITIFLMIFVLLGMYGGFSVFVLLSFGYTIWGLFKYRHWTICLPFLLNVATLLIIFNVPFNEITIDRDFSDNRAARERVVSDIASGALQPNIPYNYPRGIHLPNSYGRLSKGGNDVIIERPEGVLQVRFYTFRGIGGFSGFIYRADGKPPTDETVGPKIVEIERYDDH